MLGCIGQYACFAAFSVLPYFKHSRLQNFFSPVLLKIRDNTGKLISQYNQAYTPRCHIEVYGIYLSVIFDRTLKPPHVSKQNAILFKRRTQQSSRYHSGRFFFNSYLPSSLIWLCKSVIFQFLMFFSNCIIYKLEKYYFVIPS